MIARETFDTQLKALMDDVLEICDHAISSYELAFQAFLEGNSEIARYVVVRDKVINRLEETINDQAILLITKQQPVATDLRRIVVQMKVASEMERIGDYSVNIAKEILRISKDIGSIPLKLLEHMYRKSIEMLKVIVVAYAKEDAVEARDFAALDDEIDALYALVMQQFMQQNQLSQSVNLSLIAHYIERVADHATNISEHLLYLKNGKHYDLNS